TRMREKHRTRWQSGTMLIILAALGCTQPGEITSRDSPGGGNRTPYEAIPMQGPLRRLPTNPRYFTNDTGRAIYLAGSHSWETFQDMAAPGAAYDYYSYLELMQNYWKHNFFRMWLWECAWGQTDLGAYVVDPMPYQRPGPGIALDNNPRFNFEVQYLN